MGLDSSYGIIYKITNIANSKVYIGKTKSKNPKRYIRSHFTNALSNPDNSRYFYRAIRKYGEDTAKRIIEKKCKKVSSNEHII